MMAKVAGNGRILDLTRGAIPIAVALSLLIAVGVACIGIGRTLKSYDDAQGHIAHIATEVAAMQRILAAWRPEDRWTRSDQVLFCWEAERANPSWRCPAVKVDRAQFQTMPVETRP